MSRVFNDKVVLVTGASRGIGREIALAFAREGAKLILAARSAEGLAATARDIERAGGEALTVPTDVTSDRSVADLMAKTVARFGRLDVVVNNAGIARVGEVASPGFIGDLEETLKASLFGMVRVTRAALPLLKAQSGGTIVNMSSVMGRKAFAGFGSYATVMHAVSGFSDALRQELAASRIKVCVIHPALTATGLLEDASEVEMPPPFRYMTPLSASNVADGIVRAVARGRPRVVMPGIANMLLLGEALSPRIGDLVARAIAVRPIAWLLGLYRGKSYHQMLGERPSQRGSS